MYNVAIIGASEKDLNWLRDKIFCYGKEKNIDFCVTRYKSGKDFLTAYDYSVDMIFLDVKLPDLNGMEVAQKLRFVDYRVPVVLMDDSDEYVIEGYSVNATDFIIFPADKECLKGTMSRLVRKADEVNRSMPNRLRKILIY